MWKKFNWIEVRKSIPITNIKNILIELNTIITRKKLISPSEE